MPRVGLGCVFHNCCMFSLDGVSNVQGMWSVPYLGKQFWVFNLCFAGYEERGCGLGAIMGRCEFFLSKISLVFCYRVASASIKLGVLRIFFDSSLFNCWVIEAVFW